MEELLSVPRKTSIKFLKEFLEELWRKFDGIHGRSKRTLGETRKKFHDNLWTNSLINFEGIPGGTPKDLLEKMRNIFQRNSGEVPKGTMEEILRNFDEISL